jgi:nicotinamidase/pyrazinamidase
MDAIATGFPTRVLVDLTAGVAADSTATALADMHDAGVELI